MNTTSRRGLLGLHRWLGGIFALFLVVLSLTGLALNHSERLGLDRSMIRVEWVLKRYGMAFPKVAIAIELSGQFAAVIDGELWWDGEIIGPLEAIVGVSEGEGWFIVGGLRRSLLITQGGELIDILEYPADVVSPHWGRIGALTAIHSDGQLWVLNESLDGWSRESGKWEPIELPATNLPESVWTKWKAQYAGGGISVYRLLLDLHAGRFFGLPGTLVMDAAAVAILYLCVSGLAVWMGRKRGRKSDRR